MIQKTAALQCETSTALNTTVTVKDLQGYYAYGVSRVTTTEETSQMSLQTCIYSRDAGIIILMLYIILNVVLFWERFTF